MNDDGTSRHEALGPADADAVGIVVAQLADMKLPLGEGLLAAAREVGSRRVSRSLARLGRAVQQGAPLAAALESCRGVVPPALAAALSAADKSGQLGPVLAEWTENQLAAQARARQLRQALAYPVVCLAAAIVLVSLIGWFLLPVFEQMYHEFQLDLPGQTYVVLWVGKFLLPLLGTAALVAAAAVVLVRLVGGRVAWSWCQCRVPLLGKLWHWSAAAESLRVLAILVDNRLPLPAALGLAASHIRSGVVEQSLKRAAAQVAAGASLSQSVREARSFPRSVAPLLAAAERSGTLSGGLRDSAAMLERRIVAQCDLLTAVVPPLIFLAIGFVLVALVGSLYGPMLQMIRSLSL